jgi:hypothetical protein
MLLLGILALCWAVDGTNSYLHYLTGRVWLYVPSNALRLATGLGFGLTLSALVWPLFHESLWRDPSNERVLSGWGDLARVVLAMVPLWAALQMDHPVLAGLIPLLDALSVTVVLGVVNSLIVLIVLGRENKAERWRETLVPLGLGLLLATGEVAAIAWLRAFLWRLLL